MRSSREIASMPTRTLPRPPRRPTRVERSLTVVARLPAASAAADYWGPVVRAVLRQIDRIRRDMNGRTRVYADDERRVYCVNEDDPRFDRMRVTVPGWWVGDYWRPTAQDVLDDLQARAQELDGPAA